MSQGILCTAVVTRLQSVLSLSSTSVEFMFDGQPPPMCGEEFFAVWPGAWRPNDIEGLDEEFGVNVTLTRRARFAPKDRRATEIWTKLTTGMDARLRQIIAAIHLDKGSDAILNAANTLLGGSVNGFVEPLKFRDGGRPEIKGPDWFSADNEGGGGLMNAGVAQTLMFGGARRIQTIESMA